jgi:hypothetical protein
VTNTPDVLTADVADMAVGLLLSVARRIPRADRFLREGNWSKGSMPLVTRVAGKAVGIVGMGRVGAGVAKRLAAFDCAVTYFDVARRTDLPYEFVPDILELARRVEFLIVTLAGGESTKSIVNAGVLDALGPDGNPHQRLARVDRRRNCTSPRIGGRSNQGSRPRRVSGTSRISMVGSRRSTMPFFSLTMPPGRRKRDAPWGSSCRTISPRTSRVSR